MNTAMHTLAAVAEPYVANPDRVHLSDGTALILRPMLPGDIHAIAEMHDRLSADTLYYRYLHPYKPTIKELADIAQIKCEEGAAFVAILQGQREKVVGMALYRRDPRDPAIAQTAFLVEDEYQGRGIGRSLTRLLIQHALNSEISALDASVHPSNQKMICLIKESGFPYQAMLEYGAMELRVFLKEPRWGY